jgi:exodeoxyribonuclease V alpha subunit
MTKSKLQKIESILNVAGIFSEIDIHFARFIAQFSTDGESSIFLAAALTSRATGNGDICLDLNAAAETGMPEQPDGPDALKCPPLAEWRRTLISSPVVGKPGDRRPLILDADNRLYLYRYWEYENLLSNIIRQRAGGELQDFNTGKLTKILKRLFALKNDEANWQAIAAVIAVFKRISVITGGPGSGKTFTIARILALLLEGALEENAKIHLAAPTGKASARLAESIHEAKQSLDCSDLIKDAIPNEVHTIHRLLKPISGTPYFYRNAENPLAADVVVIDEASMVDLALMTKLVQALSPDARLLLIGDKDQLASVEAGSVLGDICDRQVVHGFSIQFLKKIEQISNVKLDERLQSPKSASGLQDCITVLQKSYRFDPQSGIGGLSKSVNRGDSDTALAYLNDSTDKSTGWRDLRPAANSVRDLRDLIAGGYRKYLTLHDPVLAMKAFNRFKILCALKIGPFGVHSINSFAEEVLNQEGLLPTIDRGNHQWYRGRPVLITQNDYNLGLFNGDIGITLPDPNLSNDELYVYFPDSGDEFKRFPTHRLCGHETVYAMTVHKSQGSEFDHIILLLPEKDYPLLTRELIYTGLTRARKTVSIWGPQSVLKAAITRKIERTSGLRDALWD